MTVTEPRVEAPAQPPPEVSERTRHERRLGLALSAPAFIVMILVTAYPLVYAVVLSLLQLPADRPGRQGVRRAQQLRRPCSPTRCGGPTCHDHG